eukprot:731672-Pyramimonas_sp.AAC.1
MLGAGEAARGARELGFGMWSSLQGPFAQSVEVLAGAPIHARVAFEVVLGSLGKAAGIIGPDFPLKSPLEKPLPVTAAPHEASACAWSWTIGEPL